MHLREDLPQFDWLCRTLPGNIVLGELFGGVPACCGFLALAYSDTRFTFSIVAGTVGYSAIMGCALGVMLWFLVTRRLMRRLSGDRSNVPHD